MKWPSIPQPQTDGASLQNSLLAAKENIELMQGVRGKSPFILASDMQSYDDQLAKMNKGLSDRLTAAEARLNSGWDTVYDADFTSVTTVNVPNLSAFRVVRGIVYAKSDATLSTVGFQLSANNGSTWWTTAGDYFNYLNYHDESTATTLSGFGSTTATSFNSIRQAQIGADPNLGLHWHFTIDEFNKARHKFMQGNLIAYNGTQVLHGQHTGRSGTATSTGVANALRMITTSAMTGHLFIEGHRG